MAKLRTFIAVETPWPVQSLAAKLVDRLRDTTANVRWVDEAQMHFTLKFLGDVPTNDVAHICFTMQRAVAKIAPFDFRVLGAGAFPNAERPRTVWIGAEAEAHAPFIELHQALETALADQHGFRGEHRRYRPHMTLGRVRRNEAGVEDLAARIAENRDYSAGPMSVAEVTLFSSELTRRGPVYDVIGHAELGTGL